MFTETEALAFPANAGLWNCLENNYTLGCPVLKKKGLGHTHSRHHGLLPAEHTVIGVWWQRECETGVFLAGVHNMLGPETPWMLAKGAPA
jgi:hypothetical protein